MLGFVLRSVLYPVARLVGLLAWFVMVYAAVMAYGAWGLGETGWMIGALIVVGVCAETRQRLAAL